MDTTTPLKVSALANIINCVLDPVLMFRLNLGVAGAALATVFSEYFSALSFLSLLVKKQMIQLRQLFRVPKWNNIKPLLKGGMAVQLRSLLMNVSILSAMRTANNLDSSGVSAAAYQLLVIFWQCGAIVTLALSTTAAVLVSAAAASPNMAELGGEMSESGEQKGDSLQAPRHVADRMLTWGLISGITLGALQLGFVPLIAKFSSVKAVNEAARRPAILVAITQFLNGVVFTGEGVMQGLGCFRGLAAVSGIAAAFVVLGLKMLNKFDLGLTGVWSVLILFNTVRLAGVLLHRYKLGPLAQKKGANGSNNPAGVTLGENKNQNESDESGKGIAGTSSMLEPAAAA
mmetsp:Transcript_718/g.1279  ORF Transcript_718/g.1279 Transcript_718/m.1279 type:complete len:345 (+) Transcript_718:878-1912(+)